MDWLLIKLLNHLKRWITKEGKEDEASIRASIVSAINKIIEYLKKPD